LDRLGMSGADLSAMSLTPSLYRDGWGHLPACSVWCVYNSDGHSSVD
jgi:hypothetical protein